MLIYLTGGVDASQANLLKNALLAIQLISATQIFLLISTLPVNVGEKFQLKRVSQAEVFKELLNLRNDSSTGPDQIPTRCIKPAADIIAAPLTYIINTCIYSLTSFLKPGRYRESLLFPKLKHPRITMTTDQLQSCQSCRKYTKDLFLSNNCPLSITA